MTISLGFSAATTPPLHSGVDFHRGTTVTHTLSSMQNKEGCSALLEWVERCPGSTNVHIVLDTIREREELRRMQRKLQAMGCTVTRKVEFHQ